MLYTMYATEYKRAVSMYKSESHTSHFSVPLSICSPLQQYATECLGSCTCTVHVHVHDYSDAQKKRMRERKTKQSKATQHNTTQDLRQLFPKKRRNQVGLEPTPHAF